MTTPLALAQRLDDIEQRLRAIEAHIGAPLIAPQAGQPEQVQQVAPSDPPPPPPPLRKAIPTTQVGSVLPRKMQPPLAVQTPLPPQVQPTPMPPRRTWSIGDLERLLTGRLLAWIGGLALVIGMISFLGLAFASGLIGPTGRVGLGVVIGGLLLAGGAWSFEQRRRIELTVFGHVLTAAGLGIIGLALIAATRLYNLLPAELGLLLALILALCTTVIALRANAQVVAAYGLITILGAPPFLGASPTLLTVAFLATALIGTTVIALRRGWEWLPALAFVLAAPQVWIWATSNASLMVALLGLGTFWLCNALAAGGEEFRIRRMRLSPASAFLLVANAAFLVGAGRTVLVHNDTSQGLGLLLLVIAAAHALLGGWFLRAEGERHPFGLLALGTGIAALTIAIPIEFGASLVPLAWAAEAVALTWVYVVRRHGWSGVMALALATITFAHVALVLYNPLSLVFGDPQQPNVPFLHPSGLTFLFVLGATAVAGWLLPSWWARTRLGTIAALLLSEVLVFETHGLGRLFGWTVTATAIVGLAALLDRSLPPTYGPLPAKPARPRFGPLGVSLAVATFLAITTAVGNYLNPGQSLNRLPLIPFWDDSTAAALILIVGGVGAALLYFRSEGWRWGLLWAIAVTSYLLPFELTITAVVICWAMLFVITLWLGQRFASIKALYQFLAAALMFLALSLTFSVLVPPDRLFVQSLGSVQPLITNPVWNDATFALGALALACTLAWRIKRGAPYARWLAIGGGVLLVYLLSIDVIAFFQGRVVDDRTLDQLQRQGQVALSVLWAGLGLATFSVGIVRWNGVLRGFGLALLGLATCKVFLYDLASLDAVYRVLSFMALGVLLLASSFMYQRQRRLVQAPTTGTRLDSSEPTAPHQPAEQAADSDIVQNDLQ